jgi:hypothetical protein
MKTTQVVIIFGVFLFIFFGLMSPMYAVAQDHSCQIKATQDNFYVYVRDFDRDGNPTRRIIFRGWILRGNSVPIKSLSGRISYGFKADSDYRGSGRNEGLCSGNRTIILP